MKLLLRYLNDYHVRKSLAIASAVSIAALINSVSLHSVWLVIAAFLMGQTTQGTPLRQSLWYAVLILAAIMITHFLLLNIWLASVSVILIFYLANFIIQKYQAYATQHFLGVFLLPLLLLFAVFAFPNIIIIENEIGDALLGILIGIACATVFLFKQSNPFAKNLPEIFHSLIVYTQTVQACIKNSGQEFFEQMNKQHQVLFSPKALARYPEWIYEVGFNPGLRSGFRSFFLKIENLIETLASMMLYVNMLNTTEMPQSLCQDIELSLQHNIELLELLQDYFINKKIMIPTHDLTSDIRNLDENIKKQLPKSIEVIEVSKDYLALLALVREIKDAREILLQLVMALPVKTNETTIQ